MKFKRPEGVILFVSPKREEEGSKKGRMEFMSLISNVDLMRLHNAWKKIGDLVAFLQ